MAEIIDINVSEVVENVQITTTENITTVNINKVTGSGATWGEIEGTLSNQTDLQNALNLKANESELGAVAFSNDYNDLDNKPTIPTLTSQLTNDSGFITIDDVPTPDLSQLVPYAGASKNVDLGEFQIKLGQVEFDQTPTQSAGVAKLRWNDSDGTLDLGLKGGNVTLQIGQESVIRVVNKTGSNLLESNYQAVRVTGAQGQRLKIDLAQATSDLLSAETIGLVTENIDNNQEGFVTTSGLIRGVNTTGSLQGETWADGDMLYLSPSVAGRITNIKPTSPNHLITIGYVVYSHANNGQIFVKVDNGYELEELHNVTETNYTTPINTDSLLTYDITNSLWKRLTWSNIKSNLKTYFDTIYTTSSAVASQISTALASFKTDNYLDATSSIQTQLNSKQASLGFKPFRKVITAKSIGSNAVGETQLIKVPIPANSLHAEDKLHIKCFFSKTGTNTAFTSRIKATTSESMPTGTTNQIAQVSHGASGLLNAIERNLSIEAGNLKGLGFTASSATDVTFSTVALSSVAFDISVLQNIYVSTIPASSTTDVVYLEYIEISNF